MDLKEYKMCLDFNEYVKMYKRPTIVESKCFESDRSVKCLTENKCTCDSEANSCSSLRALNDTKSAK